jgi:thiol:disulfide interchange protein DsbD
MMNFGPWLGVGARRAVRAGWTVAIFFLAGASVVSAAELSGLATFGEGGHTHADLTAEVSAVAPGQPVTVALRLKMDPGWHTYWVNPGLAGLATSIAWQLPPGWTAGPLQWPTPQKLPLDNYMNYGYEGTAVLLVTLHAPTDLQPGDTAKLAAKVDWLECSEEECVPGGANLTLDLPVADAAPTTAANQALFAAARAALPQPATMLNVLAWRQGDKLFLGLEPQPGAKAPAQLTDAYFFSADSQTNASAPQILQRTSQGWVLELTRAVSAPANITTLPGVLTLNGAVAQGFAVATPQGTAPPAAFADFTLAANPTPPAGGLPGLLLLGFLGGLILNIMPCVFPVLGIKALGLARQAGAARRAVAGHGLAFTAGVLASMWALVGVLQSLRAAGAQLGWGFQLQEPAFVIGLAIFFLLFALSLSGVFEVGGSLIGVGAEGTGKAGLAGSFFQGGLAVVVATPCTAPLLAPALGAALTLPTGAAFLVFTAIALGLASPYLALSLFPGCARVLPRPGAWMETFKQLMAFPLYATVGFLLYTLAGQVSPERFLNILFALVLAGMAAWFYGRYATVASSPMRRRVGRIGALLLLFASLAAAYWPMQELDWQPWSAERVAELQKEGRPIYVDFTARWCLTCQANKDVLFHSTDRVLAEFDHEKVAMLRADWTSNDPAITAELARFGRSSVPFDLLYLPGHANPVILPSVLTPDIVLNALAGKTAAVTP